MPAFAHNRSGTNVRVTINYPWSLRLPWPSQSSEGKLPTSYSLVTFGSPEWQDSVHGSNNLILKSNGYADKRWERKRGFKNKKEEELEVGKRICVTKPRA